MLSQECLHVTLDACPFGSAFLPASIAVFGLILLFLLVAGLFIYDQWNLPANRYRRRKSRQRRQRAKYQRQLIKRDRAMRQGRMI